MPSIFGWFKVFQLWEKKSVHQHRPSTSAMNSSSRFPSLNISFQLTQELFSNQRDRVDALDAKANFALTAATGLISAALVLQSLLLPHLHSSCSILIPNFLRTLPLLLKRAIPILPLLSIYIVVVVYGINAYRTRKFIRVPNPRTLLLDYLDQAEDDTKAMLFRAMVEFYEMNEHEIRRKGFLIDSAFTALVIESILLVLLLLYQVLC